MKQVIWATALGLILVGALELLIRRAQEPTSSDPVFEPLAPAGAPTSSSLASTQRHYHARIPFTSEVTDEIRACPGVEFAGHFQRYTISVYRGDLFAWAEVEPCVEAAIAATED